MVDRAGRLRRRFNVEEGQAGEQTKRMRLRKEASVATRTVDSAKRAKAARKLVVKDASESGVDAGRSQHNNEDGSCDCSLLLRRASDR